MDIVERPATVVAGIPVVAPFDQLGTAVPQAWRELFARRDSLPAPSDGAYAEASFGLADGRYHETVGVVLEDHDLRVIGAWSAVYLPAGPFVHHRHDGPVTGIADGFGAIYGWAAGRGLTLGAIKLDVGYTLDGSPRAHDLYVDVR